MLCAHLEVEEHVEVRDADVLVLHLPAHVLDGVDGGLVVAVGLGLQGEILHPVAADLVQFAVNQTGQLHRLDLWGRHRPQIKTLRVLLLLSQGFLPCMRYKDETKLF